MKFLLYRSLLIVLLSWLFFNPADGRNTAKETANTKDSLPAQQLLVVVANGWNNLQGRLYAYNKTGSKWVFQFSNRVVLGEKGLGLGHGLVPLLIDNVPIKKEGDKKSPAGIFSIGTAFGYAPYQDAGWINNRYIPCTDTLICVDDLHSVNYNQLVKKDTAAKDYNSHEEMRLEKDYYKWGLVVNYNTDKPVAGGGSCIFIHIWESDHEGTTGCTAMKEDDLLQILHWIKASANPVLVQLPEKEYTKFAAQYGLPLINFLQAN